MTVQRRMSDVHRRGSRKQKAHGRVLLVLTCAVLFAGMFMQVTMLARVSSQTKRASTLESEIEALSADAENLELSINQFHNLDSIAVRARQLGMEQPDETQIRVVNVARNTDSDTSAHAASIAGLEGVQNQGTSD